MIHSSRGTAAPHLSAVDSTFGIFASRATFAHRSTTFKSPTSHENLHQRSTMSASTGPTDGARIATRAHTKAGAPRPRPHLGSRDRGRVVITGDGWNTMNVGIIGLGVMGSAVAGHLLEGGHTIRGFDIDSSRLEALAGMGGIPEQSVLAVAEQSEVVLLWLPSVAALDHVAAELSAAAHPGLVAVEMGTLPLEAKLRAHTALAAVGADLIDAPVSGTGHQAADATLVVFASGSAASFEKARPLFELIGKSTYHFPEFGHGSVMKYIANLLVTVHNVAAAEAHVLGIAAGMDSDQIQRIIGDSVAASEMWNIRGPMMVADSYEPPAGRLDIIVKDANIIKGYATEQGAPTPLLDAALAVYEDASLEGMGDLDAAAVCRYLRSNLRGDPASSS
jgi:putative dehydrogenase